jgi:hypothetical protein
MPARRVVAILCRAWRVMLRTIGANKCEMSGNRGYRRISIMRIRPAVEMSKMLASRATGSVRARGQ